MKRIVMLCIIFSIGMAFAKDAAGAKEHPLLKRYPGFYIRQYKVSEYDEAKVISGKFDHKHSMAPVTPIEGKVTNICYDSIKKHDDTSLFQLYKNYEDALKRLGAEIQFSCRNESCFEGSNGSVNGVFIGNWINSDKALFNGLLGSVRDEFGIITAKVPQKEKAPVWISVVMSTEEISGYRTVLLSVIEPKSLNSHKIGIGSISDVEKRLAEQGKITLEGIYFDFDKATLKPASKKTLTTIGDYLHQHPKEGFYIVGHTDNKGSYKHNLALSSNRAKAVYKYLKDKGKVTNHLQAIGIGPISPVANNSLEEGRAKNRRVELVVMQ